MASLYFNERQLERCEAEPNGDAHAGVQMAMVELVYTSFQKLPRPWAHLSDHLGPTQCLTAGAEVVRVAPGAPSPGLAEPWG